jgi:hypothetical protein
MQESEALSYHCIQIQANSIKTLNQEGILKEE